MADHFMPGMGDAQGPINEALAYIAALAAVVPRLRLGTLVCGNTYRHPAVLTKQAATIDNVSGGRLVLGLGAGWQEREHTAYGIPFFTVKQRLDMFEEACQVVKALTTEDLANFEGHYYQLHDAPLSPKPIQRPLPLLVGGGARSARSGSRRSTPTNGTAGDARRAGPQDGGARTVTARTSGAIPRRSSGRVRSCSS